MTDVEDREARGMAREALTLINSHDRLDEERWSQNERRWEEERRILERIEKSISSQFDEVKNAIVKVDTTVSNRFWSLALGIIGLLLTISGFLAVRVLL